MDNKACLYRVLLYHDNYQAGFELILRRAKRICVTVPAGISLLPALPARQRLRRLGVLLVVHPCHYGPLGPLS
jgi:hypothetical protein